MIVRNATIPVRQRFHECENELPTRPLATLKPGEAAIVDGFGKSASGEPRLLEMGITRGTTIRMIKPAPLGDPLQLLVRGFHLTISKQLAQEIFVKY